MVMWYVSKVLGKERVQMLKAIDDFVWGVPLIVLILAVGIFLTIRLRGLQITKLPLAIKHMVANEKNGEHGEVSSFGALCTALSATIGTGNIVGVATALVAGGPFYYIENGMGEKWKWLAKIFAFFGVGVGLLGIGTFTQINGITSAVNNFFDPQNTWTVELFGRTYSWTVVIAGIILTLCVALVIIGGIKRISTVAQVVVPFMALLYVVVVLIILFTHLSAIPGAIVEIVQSAFGLRAAAGGTLGSILIAMQMGIARGIFSNEAGLGSAPIAAAAAKTNEPVTQGLVSMLGTIIDTVIICTMTGLSIVITGAWDMGLEGVSVTTKAFQIGLPFPEQVASFVLMLCLVFFAFTTILGWNYYSEKCLEYLVGDKKTVLKGYRWLYILAVFIGPFMTVSAVWTIADIFNGLMALPNLVALVALSGVVVAETKKYFEKQKY